MPSDARISLDDAVLAKYLSAVDFPLTILSQPDRSTGSEAQSVMEDAETELALLGNSAAPENVLDGASLLEDAILDELLAGDFHSEDKSIAKGFFEAITAFKNKDVTDAITKKDRDALRVAVTDLLSGSVQLTGQLEQTLARARGLRVKWVETRILTRPKATVADPIRLADLVLTIRASFEFCVNLLGHERCVSLTTPRIRLEGRRLDIVLSIQSPKLLGRPRFKDLDIVFRFKILGKTFRLKIGVTTIVNKALVKGDPLVILDLGSLTLPIFSTNKNFKVVAMSKSVSQKKLHVDVELGLFE
jgi:hypothetical protein